MNRQGVLTVVSGFSGAGKGSVMKSLLKKYNYELSISATTRTPRTGEEHGREYFFLTREEFQGMIDKHELIEWAEYVGNYYGTPKNYVNKQLKSGKDVILEIEIQGALKVKEQFPNAILIFITPPTTEELKSRLIGRGTEGIDKIKQRLQRAADEVIHMDDYDYIVLNKTGKIDECVETIHYIIQNEHCKTINNKNFINKIQDELKANKEGDL